MTTKIDLFRIGRILHIYLLLFYAKDKSPINILQTL
jgi:hypothetical protein